MNEQGKYVDTFQPGRYAGVAGGLAAAVKDIGSRLTIFDPKTVNDLAARIVGAPPGSKDSVAALQLFKQLAQQETLAQLKTSLGENQRMNQAEFKAFAGANMGEAMDPETFNGMRDFFSKQAAYNANKYADWSDYVGDPKVAKPTVTGFDAKHAKRAIDHYLTGSTDAPPSARADAAKPTYPAPAARATAVAESTVPTVKQGEKADMAMYEKGAKVGPTGKVYVIENGVARPAKGRVASGKVE